MTILEFSLMTADFANGLSDELFVEIFRYLPPKNLATLYSVCHNWRRVGNSPELWRKLPFFQPIPDGASQVELRHHCFSCMKGQEPAVIEVMKDLRGARGNPVLAEYKGQPFILYFFWSCSGYRSLRLVNLVTDEERTYNLGWAVDFNCLRFHHLGFDELFVAIATRVGLTERRVTLTFLNAQLREATIPQLSIDCGWGDVWWVKPVRTEDWHRVIVHYSTVEGSSEHEVFAIVNGEWISRGTLRGGGRGPGKQQLWVIDPLVVQTENGTEFVNLVWSEYRGPELEATVCGPDGKPDRYSWHRPINWMPQCRGQTWFTLVCAGSRNYAVIAAGDELHICPCYPQSSNGPQTAWSLQLPFKLDSSEITVHMTPIGEDFLFSLHSASNREDCMRTVRWRLSTPDGKAIRLTEEQLRGDSESRPLRYIPLGVVQTEGSYAECYYDRSRQQLKKVELLNPKAMASSGLGGLHVFILLLSLYVTARTLSLESITCPESCPPQACLWNIIHAVEFAVAGVAIGAAVHYFPAGEIWWTGCGAALFVVLMGLVFIQVCNEPYCRTKTGWKVGTFVTWYSNWPLFLGAYRWKYRDRVTTTPGATRSPYAQPTSPEVEPVAYWLSRRASPSPADDFVDFL
jgi:hypothetical protein